MRSHGAQRQSWINKALCRRYSFAYLTNFHLSCLENGVPRLQTWCWAFAAFSADEFEILGMWPTETGAISQITDDLRRRGVLSIRVMSVAEIEGHPSLHDLQGTAVALRNAEPRVLEIVRPQSIAGEAIEGVPCVAIRSALNMAGRIHDGLVRSTRSKAPFASAAATSEFVAGWLQKADQRLHKMRRALKPLVSHAA